MQPQPTDTVPAFPNSRNVKQADTPSRSSKKSKKSVRISDSSQGSDTPGPNGVQANHHDAAVNESEVGDQAASESGKKNIKKKTKNSTGKRDRRVTPIDDVIAGDSQDDMAAGPTMSLTSDPLLTVATGGDRVDVRDPLGCI